MATFSRQAVLEWNGDVMGGAGQVTAGTGAFAVPATFPSTAGEAAGKTTPEELLAASHATCYGIGLRSLIGRRGGQAPRLTVTATITAEKGPGGIRIQSSHLSAEVESLEGIDHASCRRSRRKRGSAAPSRLLLKAQWRSPTTSSLDEFGAGLDPDYMTPQSVQQSIRIRAKPALVWSRLVDARKIATGWVACRSNRHGNQGARSR
jgi:lipoyl-dependent peroxiredoxin